MNADRREAGYTLVELLVATVIISIAVVAFYQVLFSGLRGSRTARSISAISQEARLGLNRMVRDTREAMLIEQATDKSFKIKIDFDGNGSFDNPNSAGDYEVETFTFDPARQVITLEVPGGTPQTLVTGVTQVPGKDVFSYSSNRLSYDWNDDGVTTAAELDAAATYGLTDVGNGDGVLNEPEVGWISSVGFALRLTDGNSSTVFYSEAQLRNRT